jgi:hypothetical protein
MKSVLVRILSVSLSFTRRDDFNILASITDDNHGFHLVGDL